MPADRLAALMVIDHSMRRPDSIAVFRLAARFGRRRMDFHSERFRYLFTVSDDLTQNCGRLQLNGQPCGPRFDLYQRWEAN